MHEERPREVEVMKDLIQSLKLAGILPLNSMGFGSNLETDTVGAVTRAWSFFGS